MSPRFVAGGSLVSAVLALAILIVPFVGVYTAAVLGPVAVALGAVAVSGTKDGGPNRKVAFAGLTLGLVALLVLVVFLATGAYSERAR